MKEESYQKYWEIIKDFNSKEELNNIKKNIESINAILYPQLKEKENSCVQAFAEAMFMQIKFSYKQIKCMQAIQKYDEELKKVSDPDLRDDIVGKRNIECKKLKKNIACINTIKCNSKFSETKLFDDISKLPKEEQDKVFSSLKEMRNNFYSIDNKMSNYAKNENTKADTKQNDNTKNETLDMTTYKNTQNDKKETNPFEKENADLKDKINNLQKENSDLKSKINDLQKENNDLKNSLEDIKKQLEEMKNNSLKSKLGNKAKTAKRKVIKAKDYCVDWMKNHKVASALIIVALAGLTTSTIVYGAPWIGAARIVSSLWPTLHHIGLGGPLHGINQFLLGNKIVGASFNGATGLWSVGGKVLNDISVLEGILRSVEGAAFLSAGAVGVAKLGKNAWLKVSKSKFADNLKSKIKSKKDSIKNLFNKNKKKENVEEQQNTENILLNQNNVKANCMNKIDIASPEDLQAFIDALEESISNGETFEDMTKEDLNDILQHAKQTLASKTKVDGKKEEILNDLNSLSEDQLADLMNGLQSVIERYKNNEIPENFQGIQINGSYGLKDIHEVEEIFNATKQAYSNNFGGRTR